MTRQDNFEKYIIIPDITKFTKEILNNQHKIAMHKNEYIQPTDYVSINVNGWIEHGYIIKYISKCVYLIYIYSQKETLKIYVDDIITYVSNQQINKYTKIDS